MAITYDNLRERIGDKLGYGYTKSNWSSVTIKTQRVERILLSALSRFYDPIILPGESEKHQWSFLIEDTTIPLVDGVWAYDLPENFSSFEGGLTYAPGTSVIYEPVSIIGEQDVMRELQSSNVQGRPCVAAVRHKAGSGEIGVTQWEIIFAPTPGDDYVLSGSMRINAVYPGATGEVPLGGQPHSQTLIEACLAECEIFDELADTVHNQRFLECLASSISHDRNVTCPQIAGKVRDPSDMYRFDRSKLHDMDEHLTLYDGQVT